MLHIKFRPKIPNSFFYLQQCHFELHSETQSYTLNLYVELLNSKEILRL